MKPAEVMVRARQIFTAARWRVQSQNDSDAIFVGTSKVHWPHTCLAVLLTLCLIVPDVIYDSLVIRRSGREQSIAISTKVCGERCEVTVTYPQRYREMMTKFLADLV